MSRSNGSRLPDPDQACFTSILYRFRWSTAVSISGNRGKIRVSSVYHATFVEGMQVTWNGRKSVRIHRGFSSLLSTQPARNTARDDLSLTNHPIAQISWRFLLSFASSSLSVATSFETRGTCKPSAIGSEANLKRGTSSTVFCRWSYYAARFEPPATRSFFHASPVLSRSSIFFASFSLAFLALLAYFFALLSLTCFPSLYCTDTNDGIESSTFSCFVSYLFVLFFFFVWNGISEFSQFFYRVYSPSFPFLLLYFCSIRA